MATFLVSFCTQFLIGISAAGAAVLIADAVAIALITARREQILAALLPEDLSNRMHRRVER